MDLICGPEVQISGYCFFRLLWQIISGADIDVYKSDIKFPNNTNPKDIECVELLLYPSLKHQQKQLCPVWIRDLW